MEWSAIIGVSAVYLPPLTNLSPKVPFVWSEKCQVAFENLKALLSDAPVQLLDFEKPFNLAVDARGVGAGAVLLQDDDGVEHPLCYFSKKFDVHQKHFSTIEKRSFCTYLGVETF